MLKLKMILFEEDIPINKIEIDAFYHVSEMVTVITFETQTGYSFKIT